MKLAFERFNALPCFQCGRTRHGTPLYEANRAVYDKLRYGVRVKPSIDAATETVHIIDWLHPQNNDFAVA